MPQNLFHITSQSEFENYRANLVAPHICSSVKLIFSSGRFILRRAELMNFEGYSRVEISGDNSRDFRPDVAEEDAITDHTTHIIITERFNHVYDSGNQYTDDCAIRIIGKKGDGLEVFISDVALRTEMSRTNAINGQNLNEELNRSEFHFTKIVNAEKVIIRNVVSKIEYIKMSNFTLRSCNNVSITNCDIRNFTCRNKGSNLMFADYCSNVEVDNNDFYKFSNDECIWLGAASTRGQIWHGAGEDLYYDIDEDYIEQREFRMENIRITNNRFFVPNRTGNASYSKIDITTVNGGNPIKGYDPNEGVWSGVNDVFITASTTQAGSVTSTDETTGITTRTYCRPGYFTVKNLRISDNEFYINSPMLTLIALAFNRQTVTDGIEICDNVIKWGNWVNSDLSGYGMNSIDTVDFNLWMDMNYNINTDPQNPYLTDKTKLKMAPILIKGNRISFERKRQQLVSDNHIVTAIKGAKVKFIGNTMTYKDKTYGTSDLEMQRNYASRGFVIAGFWDKEGDVVMADNYCDWVKNVVKILGETQTVPRVYVRAYNNTFIGDTRSSTTNCDWASFLFRHNRFFSYYYSMIFEMFANSGNVTFEDNLVKKISDVNKEALDYGVIYANWGSEEEQAQINMQFYCSGNTFTNNTESNVYNYLAGKSNITQLKMGNKYSDTSD